MIIWLMGAAGSGKTTLAMALQDINGGVVLDGDDARKWLTPDCDYTPEGRVKHCHRVWRVAQLMPLSFCAIVSPPPLPVDLLVHLVGRERNPPWPGTTWPVPVNQLHHVLDTGASSVVQCTASIQSLMEDL